MPTRPPYRKRRARRPGSRLAVAAVVLAALVLADRAGVFGRTGDDMARYNNRIFRVVHNVDGDTFDVDLPDRRNRRPTTRVRLWGVDTPETKRPNTPVQHFGPEAAALTKQLTEGSQVRLQLIDRRTRDVHRRLLAYVILPDDRLLNRVLVDQGYAYADGRFPHPRIQEFTKAMKRAERARLGLWADLRPTDLPAYLAGHAGRRQGRSASP